MAAVRAPDPGMTAEVPVAHHESHWLALAAKVTVVAALAIATGSVIAFGHHPFNVFIGIPLLFITISLANHFFGLARAGVHTARDPDVIYVDGRPRPPIVVVNESPTWSWVPRYLRPSYWHTPVTYPPAPILPPRVEHLDPRTGRHHVGGQRPRFARSQALPVAPPIITRVDVPTRAPLTSETGRHHVGGPPPRALPRPLVIPSPPANGRARSLSPNTGHFQARPRTIRRARTPDERGSAEAALHAHLSRTRFFPNLEPHVPTNLRHLVGRR